MNYKLSKEDDNDLIDLYLHGFKNFGESQAEQYYFEIEDCIKLLSETPLTCRERTEFTPAVRIHHHGSHLIIYRIQTDHILVIRILHDSMDIQRHIKNPK